MKLVLEVEFKITDEVFLVVSVSDPANKMKGMVICYEVYPEGQIMYEVRWADGTRTSHYSFELSNGSSETLLD